MTGDVGRRRALNDYQHTDLLCNGPTVLGFQLEKERFSKHTKIRTLLFTLIS